MEYTHYIYIYYRKKFHSENGEVGIIDEILNILNIKDSWVFEFGAWDCIQSSNTFNLVKKGFNSVYFEGDKKCFC